jgi:NAD(P)H-hydrate epimerase
MLDERVAALIAGKRAVAIGPGMPTGEPGRWLVDAVLAQTPAEVPLLLDADALNHLAGRLEAVAGAAAVAVLTPHPGEAGRLLGISGAEVERDRLSAVRTLAARSRAVVVLKGAGTLVCDGRSGDTYGFVTVNPTGGPWLATAGSGDVLTGIIGALLAQGLDIADAARLGVWLHGTAGDHAARHRGSRGVIASDLPDELGPILDALRA